MLRRRRKPRRRIDYSLLPLGKGPTRTQVKARKRTARRALVADIRAYVFGRERSLCRACRLRRADSMHELKPRSLGGTVSKRNSVALCGDGVAGCHGLITRHELQSEAGPLGAEGTLTFIPRTVKAAEWLRVALHQRIESPVMVETEVAP